MKTSIITLTLALIFSFVSLAQVHVGTKEFSYGSNAGAFKESDITKLKATTTVFVIPASQFHQKEDFEKAISASWTITPFKIIKPAELKDYLDGDKYSIFSFGGVFKIVYSRNGTPNRLAYISYDLWTPRFDKKGKMKGQNFYARISMYADYPTILEGFNFAFEKNGEGKLGAHLNSSKYYNWGAGYLKSYLTLVNDFLLKAAPRAPFWEIGNDLALQTLTNDTLYIPDYVNVKFNPLTGKEVPAEDDDEALANIYPFPVKYVSSAVLNEMILDAPRPIKYLMYMKTNTDKFINVYSSGQESLIYSEYVKFSFNFRNKDLRKLAKRVKKSG